MRELEQYKDYFEYLLAKNNILKNNIYINWLEEETKDKKVVYQEGKMADGKLMALKVFYEALASYLQSKNIEVNDLGLEFNIYLTYNNIVYNLGVIYDLESTYYCERVDSNDLTNVVNFQDILDDIYQIKYDNKEEKLIRSLGD